MATKGLCIPQRSIIAGVSPVDCLMSYPGHSLKEGMSYIGRDSFFLFLFFKNRRSQQGYNFKIYLMNVTYITIPFGVYWSINF